MATLTNTKIKDTYDGLLKTTDNDVIGASEKVITDGLGNNSVLSIGTASASFSSDIEVNTLTIGLGSGSVATNTALGSNALLSNTTGSQNSALGKDALRDNTTGDKNTALGESALANNLTSDSNTAVGYRALYLNEGASNTAIGSGAGDTNTTGSNNIYIGYDAVGSAATNDNEIVIGSSTTGNGSNTATYGNASITDHYFTSGTVRINSDSLRLTGATNPQVLVTDTTNSVSVGLQALDASTKIDSTHPFKIEIGNDIIQSVTSSGVEITGNLAVDTNTLYVDAASDFVGIGTSKQTVNAEILRIAGDVFINSAGTASVPTIALADTNSGLFAPSAGQVAITTQGNERMRITSGGEVYIAGTTDRGAYNLQCNGTGVWGQGAYVNGSDFRFKEDINPIESGLDVVEKLKPVSYKYKEEFSRDTTTQAGFIAQDLQEALEGKLYLDGIVKSDSEYLSVAYQSLIPILTKAIQELKAEVESLKSQING